MKRTRRPGKKKPYEKKWTEGRLASLEQVLSILKELDEYKPLTVRQIFYQRVGKGWIANTASRYSDTGDIIKHGRYDGYIPEEDIEDKTRAKYDLSGWSDHETYLDALFEQGLKNYHRDLLQTQPKYLEIWIEKNALSSIFINVAQRYTIPVHVTQNNSTSNLYKYKNRLQRHTNQQPVILFFSDFDPQGDNMLDAAHKTLETKIGVQGVEYKQIALRNGDIERYGLFQDFKGLKEKDPLTSNFRWKYGEDVVPAELDALTPVVMKQVLEDAIINELDMDAYREEQAEEEKDFSILKEKIDDIKEQLK